MIYLDNSATTKPNAACVQAMTRLLCDTWGNPSSVHELGIAAERELKNARKEVAASLGAEPDRRRASRRAAPHESARSEGLRGHISAAG